MIKLENGTVYVEGTKIDLMAELSILMKGLMDRNVLDEEDLEMVLNVSRMMHRGEEDQTMREAIALASLLFGKEN